MTMVFVRRDTWRAMRHKPSVGAREMWPAFGESAQSLLAPSVT